MKAVWNTSKWRVCVAGKVIDQQTNKSIPQCEVVLSGNSLNEARTRTRPDGVFLFMGELPDGKYTLRAFNPSSGARYGKAEGIATVSRDTAGHFKLSYVTLALPATTITGIVTASNREAGLPMAEVRMRGSGERALTNSDGRYVLSGIEPSKNKRTVIVSAQGYKSLRKEITIEQPGAVEQLNLTLAPEGSSSNSAAAT